MFSKLLSSVPLVGAALLWTAPALAQSASQPRAPAAPDSAAGMPNVCRVAAWTSGGPCGVAAAPGYARQGGQLANAIMFFGGSGVQLVPTPPNAMRTSGEGGAAVVPATLVRPEQRPELARPPRIS